MRQHPAHLHIFDLLYMEACDVRIPPLQDRNALLHETAHRPHHLRWTPYQAEKGKAKWRQASSEGSEGITGKRFDSPYVEGRSSWWVKIKCHGRQESVIGQAW